MKTISNEDLHRLISKGKTDLNYKSNAEERQAKALEEIVAKMALVLQTNNKAASILLAIINKIKIPDIKIPEFPEPAKKWQFNVSRNSEGFIKEITAERI